MKNEQLIALIDKYLAGNCTPAEALRVEQWYESLQNTGKDFYAGEEKFINASAERSLTSVRSKLELKGHEGKPLRMKRYKPVWQWAVAACLAVIISMGALVYVKQHAVPDYTIVKTSAGQIRKVQLPDGTQVWLNAGSQLKYASDYNTDKRHVWLDGEAFFDVRHNPQKPFDVAAAGINTHVLGTAFSISAYPGSLIKTVTVIRGKVQVNDGKNTFERLLPNKSLEYTVATGRAKIGNIDAGQVISWTTGKLVFIDMPMQDIAIHLQRWYGVNFIFKDQQLKNTRFTASFNNTVALKELLAIMSEVSHVNYKLDEQNRRVTIYDKLLMKKH